MTRVSDNFPHDMPLDAKSQYVCAVRHLPQLTDYDQARRPLLARIERGKREALRFCPDAGILEDARLARDELIESFQTFVMFLAHRWERHFRSQTWLDLVQEGNLALLRMIEHYDLEHSIGGSLLTLAGKCIHHAYCRLLRDRESLLRLPGNVVEAGYKTRRLVGHLTQELGGEPRACELAQIMRVSQQQLAEWLTVQERQRVEPLEALLLESEESEERAHITPLYSLAPTDDARQAALEDLLERGFEVLTERQQEVVARYHGLAGFEPQTFKQIGVVYGATEVAAGRCYHQALAKLKRYLATEYGELSGQELEGYYTASQAAAVLEMDINSFTRFARLGRFSRSPFGQGRMSRYLQREIDALAAERRRLATDYYTLPEVIEKLGVSTSTVRAWVLKGKLSRYLPDRYRAFYPRQEVDALAAQLNATQEQEEVA